MSNIELDLFDNATDSLNEALFKYQQGKDGDTKAYKFCIQHLAHFLELILKFYVTRAHPLLIYKNPFAKSIGEDSQTIGLYEAINFLKNEGYNFSDKFEKDLEWLKKLRNRIEHHKFSMDVEEVEKTIGRLMSAVHKFDESHENIDLSAYVSSDQYDLFHILANTYEGRVNQAELAVKEAEKEAYKGVSYKEYDQVNFNIYHCYECDHDTMIPNEGSSTGYKCTFCGNEDSYEGRVNQAELAVKEAEKEAYKGVSYKEYNQVNFNIYHCYECDHDTMIPNEGSSTGYKCTFCGNEDSEDIEVDCDICGTSWAISEMVSLEKGEYICPWCTHDPEYAND